MPHKTQPGHENKSTSIALSILTGYVMPEADQIYLEHDKGGGDCVCPHLSVCLLARLLKNAFMDLDEMIRITQCGCRNQIAFSDIVCAATQNFITSGKIPRRGIGRLLLQRGVVLKWY